MRTARLFWITVLGGTSALCLVAAITIELSRPELEIPAYLPDLPTSSSTGDNGWLMVHNGPIETPRD